MEGDEGNEVGGELHCRFDFVLAGEVQLIGVVSVTAERLSVFRLHKNCESKIYLLLYFLFQRGVFCVWRNDRDGRADTFATFWSCLSGLVDREWRMSQNHKDVIK